MDFSGELAEIQRLLASSHDMTVRRTKVLEALGAAPGEHILEVGCGSGLYLREIGAAVGAAGIAVGVDLSEDQAQAASTHCADLPQVQVQVGDLLGVRPHGHPFDASLSVQVLEYIHDIGRAVEQLARVTRPGGRFVNVATTWGALYWTGGDATLTSRIISIWERHAPHPNLPVALPSVLGAAGFGNVQQRPIAIINRHFHPSAFGYGAARLMAAFARASGDMSQEDIDGWLRSLEEGDTKGVYFLSSVPVLTTATRL